MAQGQERTASGPAPEPGYVGQGLGLVGRTLAWLILAWLLAVTIECCGVLWWWPQEGTGHSRRLLAAELGYVDASAGNLLIADPPAFVRASADHIWSIWEQIGVIDLIQRHADPASSAGRLLNRLPAPALPQPLGQRFEQLTAGVASGWSRLPLLLHAVVGASQVFAVRLAVLALSLPVFFLTGLAGIVEGLIIRDLRRWGGGRESSFLHRHALAFVYPSVALAWLVYLAGPWAVNTAFVVLPFAMLFGIAVAIAIGSFKKYL